MPDKQKIPHLHHWQYVIAALAVMATLAIASAFWYGNLTTNSDTDTPTQTSEGNCSPNIAEGGGSVSITC